MSGKRGASNKTSQADASRIQSTQAKGGQGTGKASFAARSQGAAAKNANAAGAGKPAAKATPAVPSSPPKK
ncbi:hypothetical protein FA95DRAFT_1604671 [Auriscalpium vulgare]|uniref:Uncharacterized protein n=1 Tax=Auriscalpium vulgare TaxID=40419 RepID=A0ACB8RZW2_9AGAM|nr:hypothetical protein FA95DRAFT_1604671 [Auriscalpium vulgare]